MRNGFIVMLLGLVLAAAASPVAAEDVWRLAGTMNGWNTNDPSWAMVPKGGSPLVHTLERAIGPGAYRFKFVKNGEWGAGHLGGAPGTAELEQPGEDLTLRISGEAVYRIGLDLRTKSWSIVPVKVEETHFDVRLVGVAMSGRSLLLDATRTLTVQPWDRSKLRLDADGQAVVRVQPVDPAGRLTRLFLGAAGPTRLTVTLTDAGATFEKAFDVEIEPEAALRFSTASDRNRVVSVPFEAQSGGVKRAIVNFARDDSIVAVEVNTGTEVVRAENGTVSAGTYAAEIRDGSVVTQRDPSLPLMLMPGRWRTLAYAPRQPVESVHVLGDFNGWARPGARGAVEMMPRGDGSFAAIVNMPLGFQRYRFLIDGEREVVDPTTKRTEAGPGGAPSATMLIGPRPGEFPAAEKCAIARDGVRHDPASWLDFTPISRSLGLADVSLTTLAGDVERVAVTVEVAGTEGRSRRTVPMRRAPDSGGFDRWSARVMTGEPRVLYSFTLSDGAATFTTDAYVASIEPAPDLPAWAMGAVWYQIFPERFRNGNPLNDPHGPGVFQPGWTDDWFTISPEEEKSWRARAGLSPEAPWPPRKGGNFFHVVWDRRYGGDLQGVAEKFAYLRSLGVDALYLNPIFEADSLHKYDATDYRHIDDNFGTPAAAGKTPERFRAPKETTDPTTWAWTPADRYFVDEFLPAAKKAGLRVVLDGVFNHTGRPFFAFRDIEERGRESAFKDWFFVKFDDAGRLHSWESWFNTGALPKFRQEPDGDLVEPVKQHLFGVTRRWMDPNGDGNPADGIDGWRLDVALDVGLPFWREWRRLVKSFNPEAVILAEIWDDASAHLAGDAFDTQMHYPFARPVTEWVGVKPGMPAAALAGALGKAFDDLPQTNLIHQTLLASHDTDRLVSMLQNPGREYDQGNRPQDHDSPYKDGRPAPGVYRRSLLAVAMQALWQGAPMIYYGDEVGMWGADDPSDRKPYPWSDLPDRAVMKNPDERADKNLLKEYEKLFGLRRDPKIGPVLRYGSTRVLESGDPAVFAFERELNGVRVAAVINRGEKAYATTPLRSAAPGGPGTIAAETAAWWVAE
jgi:glycosidase